MSAAGRANVSVIQGEDFVAQIFWSDNLNQPYTLCHPAKMQVRTKRGGLVLELSSQSEQAQGLVLAEEQGLIQVYIPASVTSRLPVGSYSYDLFVTYESRTTGFGAATQTVQKHVKRVVAGNFNVEDRVTFL